jgi:hypothetical protein
MTNWELMNVGSTIIVGVLGPIIAFFASIYLDRKGYLEKLYQKHLWKPYELDKDFFSKAVDNSAEEFSLITGDADIVDRSWSKEPLEKLKEKAKDTNVRILITGNIQMAKVRERLLCLKNDFGFRVYVIKSKPLAYALHAIFTANAGRYNGIKQNDKRGDNYVVRMSDEEDLTKLITGYFEITDEVREVKNDGDEIIITLSDGTII